MTINSVAFFNLLREYFLGLQQKKLPKPGFKKKPATLETPDKRRTVKLSFVLSYIVDFKSVTVIKQN